MAQIKSQSELNFPFKAIITSHSGSMNFGKPVKNVRDTARPMPFPKMPWTSKVPQFPIIQGC